MIGETMNSRIKILFLISAVIISSRQTDIARADSYVGFCDHVEQIGPGNTILVLYLYWPPKQAVEEAYIYMTGNMVMGLYHVDPDYEEFRDLSITVYGYLEEIDEVWFDVAEYTFEEEGQFVVRAYFDDANFLSLISSYNFRFQIEYAPDLNGVPVIEPYLEDFSATLVILADDSTSGQNLSMGDIKKLWR